MPKCKKCGKAFAEHVRRSPHGYLKPLGCPATGEAYEPDGPTPKPPREWYEGA